MSANDGKAIVEAATPGREELVPSEHRVLRVRCSRCGEWSAHVTPDREHLVGCLEASVGASPISRRDAG